MVGRGRADQLAAAFRQPLLELHRREDRLPIRFGGAGEFTRQHPRFLLCLGLDQGQYVCLKNRQFDHLREVGERPYFKNVAPRPCCHAAVMKTERLKYLAPVTTGK